MKYATQKMDFASRLDMLTELARAGDGQGFGATIKSVEPVFDFVLDKFVGSYDLFNPRAILPGKRKPLCIIAAHGPLTAPLAGMAIIGRLYLDKGLGDMVAGFYPHPALFWLPGMDKIFSRIGTPTKVYDAPTLVGLLKSGKMNIAATAPEGLSCHFTWDEYVGPLRSGGMIETAIRADADLCLFTHLGGRAWAIELKLPLGLSLPMTRGLQGLYIPLPPVRKIPRYSIYCKRFAPLLTKARLEKLSARERHMAISLEMERVRNELNLMTDELKRRIAKKG
ncbi:MAG: hypothetical protein QMD09_00800 [Desulfatibacillaceae bacterium]|nr:hypothetical protein [Desulfatibacillaceae bacterium]